MLGAVAVAQRPDRRLQLDRLALAAGALSEAQGDIVQALQSLGYNDREARAALKALPAEVGVSEGIKLALKALNR